MKLKPKIVKSVELEYVSSWIGFREVEKTNGVRICWIVGRLLGFPEFESFRLSLSTVPVEYGFPVYIRKVKECGSTLCYVKFGLHGGSPRHLYSQTSSFIIEHFNPSRYWTKYWLAVTE